MQNKKDPAGLFFTTGIYLTLPAASIYHGLKYSVPVYTITANVFISVILAAILDRYMKYIYKNKGQCLQNRVFFILVFLLANIAMAWGSGEEYGYLWMLPAVVAVTGTGLEQGIMVYGILLVQNVMLHAGEFNAWYLIIVLLFGVFTVWILSKQIRGKTLPYVFISLLSVDAVLQILQYQFQVAAIKSHQRQVVTELISVVLMECFITGYLLYRWHREAGTDGTRERLAAALLPDHPLLQRLQAYSEPLFQHSEKISTLAAQAAEYMECNVLLAQAGGLYHEIGRMVNKKEYISAGVELLQENDMPEELQDVVRQHGTGPDSSLPQSMEAVIVMMSENILTTSDYLEKQGKRKAISDRRLVEVVINNRAAKGSFAECGITEEQIGQLKEFYVKHAFAADTQKGMEDQVSK